MSHRDKIYDSIIEAVGGTPMVRLSRTCGDLPAEVLAKCEFMNPGGSVKDRIGVRMLLDAEAEGLIKPGDTLIEPTSGNTGIGLALTAAVRGYRVIITMPEKMSQEKQVVLEALGAEIIRTPTEAAFDSPDSHISVAKRLRDVLPNAHILDQYGNPSNPRAHEEGTAREIIEQTGGKLDAVVISAGTGGTITGVARILKKEMPHVRIIGVDPVGSILAGPEPVKSYKVEGIGYDFIPDVLDRNLVDEWVKSNDRDSFLMARQLIRKEGLLCGGSCGAAVWAARRVAAQMEPGQRVVAILADSIRNYMTKFASDAWMRQNGFTQTELDLGTIGDALLGMNQGEVVTVSVDDSVGAVMETFREHGISQFPVLDGGRLAGILTESDLLARLVAGACSKHTKVAEIMERRVATVGLQTPASELPRIFERGEVALVIDEERQVLGILTKMDLIELLANKPQTPLQAAE
ncbi:MAG: cystathionine beta-synthase [Myxococcota bacterium]